MAKLVSYFGREGRRGLSRRRCDAHRRGVTAVEFALLAPTFFLMLMGTTETCLMLGAQQLMENAAYNTSRLAKTGYVMNGQTQAQTVSQVMNTELQSYGALIDTANVTVTQSAFNNFAGAAAGGGVAGYGTQQQIVVYTVTYPWKLFTPMLSALMGTGGIVSLTSTIVVRNEPYG